MCLGGGGDGGAAERQRQEEEARQGRIREGKTNIENTFAGFDDDFYDTRRTSYLDYANPQLEDQFKDATRDLTLALARSGLLNSSAKARRFGDLKKQYDTQSRAIADKAQEFENQSRSAVGAAKSDLLTQNQSLADPTLAAANAQNRAENLTRLPAFSPLGLLFSGITEGIATQADLERRGKNAYELSGLFNVGSSARNVNE